MLIAMVAALVATGQAEPLDPDLACIVDRIPASTRTHVLDEVATGTGGNARQVFQDAAEACADARNWTPELTRTAGRLSAALVVTEESAILLQRNGLSPELVHDWFYAQPAAIQQNVAEGQDPAVLLVEHLLAGGVSQAQLESNAGTIGLMLGAMQLIERIGAGIE
ncbi:MAG: hypothetical protein ACXWUN_02560 [Allosphingosinicella sp.]